MRNTKFAGVNFRKEMNQGTKIDSALTGEYLK